MTEKNILTSLLKGRKLRNFLTETVPDRDQSPFPTPPSAQPPRIFDKLHLLDDEESVDFGDFDLGGFTQEEVHVYNSMAEPGQRLQDAISPQKMQGLMRNTSSKC